MGARGIGRSVACGDCGGGRAVDGSQKRAWAWAPRSRRSFMGLAARVSVVPRSDNRLRLCREACLDQSFTREAASFSATPAPAGACRAAQNYWCLRYATPHSDLRRCRCAMRHLKHCANMGTVHRPRCFLDVSIGAEPAGRLIIELFVDKVPKTCEKWVHPILSRRPARLRTLTLAAVSASYARASATVCPTPRRHFTG